MTDTPTPTTVKAERADAGRALAATAAAEAIELIWQGRRSEAEDVMVHAYHQGAKAMDLLDQYHQQRSALERTSP